MFGGAGRRRVGCSTSVLREAGDSRGGSVAAFAEHVAIHRQACSRSVRRAAELVASAPSVGPEIDCYARSAGTQRSLRDLVEKV